MAADGDGGYKEQWVLKIMKQSEFWTFSKESDYSLNSYALNLLLLPYNTLNERLKKYIKLKVK